MKFPGKYPKLNDIVSKYSLNKIPSHMVSYEEKAAFLAILEVGFNQLKENHPEEHSRFFEKEELTICDIGCGHMLYGSMLVYYFLKNGKNVRIIGIDGKLGKAELFRPRMEIKEIYQNLESNGLSQIEFIEIPSNLYGSENYLKEKGIDSFDLITMFNPDQIINIGDIPVDFRESALIFMALNDDYGKELNPDLEDGKKGVSTEKVWENLHDNGYEVIAACLNPYFDIIRRDWANKYNPILISQRRKE